MSEVHVIVDTPPNIAEIRAVFPLTGQEVFAWGDIIYNPSGGEISLSLQAHEMVHFRQQAGDPVAWWDRYLVDPQFRFDQELEAHQAEFRAIVQAGYPRNQRRYYLKHIAKRLASPMYGSIANYATCRRLIAQAAK